MIQSAAVTVGTSATALNTAEALGSDALTIIIRNSSLSDIYVGGSTVSTTNGFTIPSGTTSPAFTVAAGDVLYGIAAAPLDVRVLRIGVG